MTKILHYVLKTTNLKKDLEQYLKQGMVVLRHEEFGSGCEAQCNGPYARPWSKTMVGYGPEKDHFVLELAFNYGIRSYSQGNAIQHVQLKGSQNASLTTVDGQSIKIGDYPAVVLNVTSIDKAMNFYTKFLKKRSDNQVTDGHSVIELNQVDKVEHGAAKGRLAVSVETSTLPSYRSKFDKIHTDITELPTDGKATVTVLVVEDPDGHELCLVGEKEFMLLAQPTYDTIDFDQRVENGSRE